MSNLESVTEKLHTALDRAERPHNSLHLIAVSKTFEPDHIRPVLEQGHRIFGENKVQECRDKWIDLKSQYPDVELHMIGSLQKNKVKYLPNLVDVIHTLDSESLAGEIQKHMVKNPDWNPVCFVQVNTGNEPQKSGVLESDVDAFIAMCKTQYGLNVTGLMCIPPAEDNPALHFALLRKIAQRNALPQLSMGMSADFTVAVEFDATYVRVGSAIFGDRTVKTV